ncbi:MAG: 1-phosphofructokinase family hexose kinase [Balneolaceae bacterium]|nr:1-phosphofructokinase family hexose kinase [Balneolaceae bacterium]
MSNRVLTITMNPAVDVNSEADKVVTNQKVRCEKPDYDPGGGGINVARVLTRLGIQANAFYLAGGITGEYLTYLLDEENVPHKHSKINGMTRENTSVIDRNTGEQYRFVFPGPTIENAEWKNTLDWIEENLNDFDIVVGSGSLPPGVPTDFYSMVGSIVLENGKEFILDTSGDFLSEGLKNGATYIKPNQEEFEELKKQKEADSMDDLLEQLFSQGVENVIYTLGSEETKLINKNGSTSFKPPQIEVNSSIGAGDSFVGGLVAGLVTGMSTRDAVLFGIATAASTLKSFGTDLCELEDVKSIYKDLSSTKKS